MQKKRITSCSIYVCSLFFANYTLDAASVSRSFLSRAIAPIQSFVSAHFRLAKTAGIGAAVGAGYLLYKWWWNRKYRDTFYCGNHVHAFAILPNGQLVTANLKSYGILEPWDFQDPITIKNWNAQLRECLQSFDIVFPGQIRSVQSLTPLSNEQIAIRLCDEQRIYLLDLQSKRVQVISYPPAPQECEGRLAQIASEIITLEVKRGDRQSHLIARNGSAAYRWNAQNPRWDDAQDLDHEQTQRITFGNKTAWNNWNSIKIEERGQELRSIRTDTTGMLMAGLSDGRLASVNYNSLDGTGLVKIWNIDTGACEQEISCGFPVTAMTGLPDGNVVVAGNHFEAGAKILRVAPRRDGLRGVPPDSLHPMNLI